MFVRFSVLLFLLLSMSASVSASAALPDFRQIVDGSAPAVVKILVESEGRGRQGAEQMEQVPEYLRRFFRISWGAGATAATPSKYGFGFHRVGRRLYRDQSSCC